MGTATALRQKVSGLLDFLEPEERQEIARLARRESRVDPVKRLLDPAFNDMLWYYEHSRIDTEIPGKLHARQMEILKSPAKHRWFFGGNQSGKTTAGAVDCVLLALGRHPWRQTWQAPVTIWASALTWELWEKILLPELLTWIPYNRILAAPEPHRHSTNRDILIRADNGRISRITGKAAEQGADKYQSARVHQVWLDEEHPEQVWNEMQPRLVRHGGSTLATLTPLKGLTYLYHRIYEPAKRGALDRKLHFVGHAGMADNPSISKDSIAAIKEELKHNPAQLEARLYGRFVKPSGLVLPFDEEKHRLPEAVTGRDLEQFVAMSSQFAAAVDFGIWRFAFLFAAADENGHLTIVEEVFSQRESLERRAQKIHDCLARFSLPAHMVPIVGDCANPQDILELNLAFERIGSPYRVAAVDAEKKIIRVGVERLENLMNRGALRFRRELGDGAVWYLGMNAATGGKPVEGSRLFWEMNNWRYPQTDDGKVQKDLPDDASADGADMMAALRYLVMSWWQRQAGAPKRRRNEDTHEIPEQLKRKRESAEIYTPSMVGPAADSRLPGWRMPRWGGES
jgi:phage terminase large subunit-like protein